ncbi:hypothetical protein N1F78_00945 [Seonamhaeicola sp. MEBiC1930]|uniref:hypothetical protein n=1 Tax=Seonamhaeicola sp. MEBiC01930 TaxID=2976768 RepID=UPI00325487E8
MKTLLFSYKFLLVTLMSLPLTLCSSEDNNETDDPIIDNGNGGNNSSEPSEDIETLYLTNITRAGKGAYLAMLKGAKTPYHGTDFYRQRLNLNDESPIFSVSGGSYNKDGSIPTTKDDNYSPYNRHDVKRNNVTISFVFIDEANANAELIIDKSMTFASQGWTIPFENNSVRVIEKGSFTIKVKEARLNDDITPLGKDKDNSIITSFKFKDEVIDNNSVEANTEINGLKYGNEDTHPINITHNELLDIFREEGKTHPIKIIETALVHGGKRIEPVAQPPSF